MIIPYSLEFQSSKDLSGQKCYNVIVRVKCPQCGSISEIFIKENKGRIESCLTSNKDLQVVFPELSDSDIAVLQTGLCKECQ